MFTYYFPIHLFRLVPMFSGTPIRGVSFCESGLIIEVAFCESGLIRGVASCESVLIRGVAFS